MTLNDWHDFFVMLGGATAALTGLLFVAMSLHVRAIGRNPPERRRARGTLTGLIAVLLICAAALRPGMDLRTFGLLLLVGALGLFVQALFVIREFSSLAGERRARMIAGWRLRSAAYLVFELTVATVGVLLVLERSWALDALAAMLCATIVIMIVNTWSLLLDVSEQS